MSDLVAFLRARYDEDEAAVPAGFGAEWELREIEAKRKILARYEQFCLFATAPETPAPAAASHAAAGLRGALYDLAAVYSDHPDYDPAWAHS